VPQTPLPTTSVQISVYEYSRNDCVDRTYLETDESVEILGSQSRQYPRIGSCFLVEQEDKSDCYCGYMLTHNHKLRLKYYCSMKTVEILQDLKGYMWTNQHSYKLGLLKKTPWSESASELYRPSDRRLSAK
jgi:hypothetical protein